MPSEDHTLQHHNHRLQHNTTQHRPQATSKGEARKIKENVSIPQERLTDAVIFLTFVFTLASYQFHSEVMGKCKFNEAWLDKNSFRHWLKPVHNNVFEAFCTICKKRIQLGTMKALESHAKSSKHMNALNGQKQTPFIACVFQPTNVSQLAANMSEAAAGANVSQLAASAADPPAMTATRVDLRTAFGSTPTMKAEVLWTLNTIAKHQSYNGNEGISELFKCMFPDSNIAKTFTCGPDKTAYIAKFGLAIHIKEELVSKVNKSPFVLMFDESLNETTKPNSWMCMSASGTRDRFSPDIWALSLWDIPLHKTCCRISK